MTTAEAALRQLLADVEAARGDKQPWSFQRPILSGAARDCLAYLEKLARDGLAVSPRRYHWPWRPVGKAFPYDWQCTFGAETDTGDPCRNPAVYAGRMGEGACEEHAVAMGAKAGT